ncbi:SAM-dependent methyltransferase [Chryseobacterium rhizosphaerae]|uniref:class I SAM-dependent methyltransferase n=1 Tax=Chryseobacterium rhizosphaerae TaxID=395937 RepID=UPI002866D5B4|nr:class I SAM-dependent methyltransferase [Chryseobacterium rhizosphaerae]MDR6547410.1 SAM-dependent methyltransferase [Chryseobacterium rhizosphaerae]
MENNTWLQKWDERYTNEEFVYGTDPNLYLQTQLKQLKPGSILFPADGEGRNSVYAALQGWESSAFDISTEGQKKALQLAEQHRISIDYQVGELSTLGYQEEQFDAIALIYAHFPAEIKSSIHRMLDIYLRKGGFIIFEAFSKNHLDYIARNPNVGGPKDIESLFSIDEIKADFPGYDIVELAETEIELKEGLFHNGTGSVIRFMGRKQ